MNEQRAIAGIPAGRIHSLAGGFSLVEFVGVLAVLAILAATLAPVVIKRVDIAAANAEQSNLLTFSNAVVLQALRSNSIPGQAAWSATVANWLSYPTASVSTNARRNPRAYLIDTNGLLGASGYTQTSAGTATAPANVRAMLVSSLGKALPASLVSATPLGSTEFSNLWNAAVGTVPTTGVWNGWAGKPGDVLVQRVNLQPLFYRLILNPNDPNRFGSFTINTNNTAQSARVINIWSRYYFDGTVVGLYDTNNGPASFTLESREILQRDASYVYENGLWRAQIFDGRKPPINNNSNVNTFEANASAFLSTTNSNSKNGSTPTVVLAAFYTLMLDYYTWSLSGFPPSGNGYRGVNEDQGRLSNLMNDLNKP